MLRANCYSNDSLGGRTRRNLTCTNMGIELAVFACAFQHLRKRRQRNAAALERTRRLQTRRRRLFHRFQARERMLFTLTLSLIMATTMPTRRSLWMKPRSNTWWEEHHFLGEGLARELQNVTCYLFVCVRNSALLLTKRTQ